MIYQWKEASLLVSLLRAALGGETPVLPDAVDWDNLYALSTLQKVEAMVCVGLHDVGNVPDDVRARFEQAYKKEITAQIIRHNEGVKILNALELNGVDCVPLKGWIMQDMYPNPAMRYMCDLDILFKPEQSAQVQHVLEALDYVPQELGGNPEVYYKKPIMNIEMHKRIARDEIGYFDSAWERVHLNKHCQHTYSMTWEDYYIYMIAHLHKHFVGGGTGVRYVCDTELFLRKHGDTLDRGTTDAMLEKLGLLEFERKLRALCGAWFRDETADDALTAFSRKLLFCGVFGMPERSEENRVQNTVQSMPGKRTETKKLLYILTLLFPPLSVMRDVYPALRKAPFLLPFFWIVRGVQRLFTGRDEAKRLLKGAQELTREMNHEC